MFMLAFFYCGNVVAQHPFFSVDANYLSRHDVVYRTPAYEGFEGFPLGNGDVGGLVWNTHNGFEFQINKNDLFDQHNEESRATLRNGVRLSIDLGAPGFEWMYLDSFQGRLSLKDAEASFFAETPFMRNSLQTWVSTQKNVWNIHVKSTSKELLPQGTTMKVGLERWGSRTFPGWYGYFSKDTRSGLGTSRTFSRGDDIVLETSYPGLRFAVACRIIGHKTVAKKMSANRIEVQSAAPSSEKEFDLVISFVTSFESDDPTRAALSLLNTLDKNSVRADKAAHRVYWQKFWQQSFVHLNNDYLENTYYLRRYLMGSSSRGKFPVVFNGGLWTWNHDVRNWVTPHHWNTQQQYWGLAAQNDVALMLPYLNTYFNLMPRAREHALKRGANNAILWAEPHDFFGDMTFWDRGDMLNNFTPASQIAGLFWDYFQYTSDTLFLKEKAYPFMRAAAEFYVQKLQWDSLKNEYFLFPSQAYESPRTNQLRNPITDRNVILSNFSHCITAATILGVDSDKTNQWKNVIDHIWPVPYRTLPDIGEVVELAWYPDGTLFPRTNDHGKWLNAMSQNTSAVFPAGLIGLDQKDSREFNAVTRIVQHHSPVVNAISPNPIVAARLGMGNELYRMMENGIRRLQHFPQGLFYNIDHWYNLSRYMDSLKVPDISAQRDYIYDERSSYPNRLPAKPFIQCGLEPQSIYGAAINEMLMQSHEGKIRIFPAIPDNWSGAFTLLARGSFLVSSELKKDGTITGIVIQSQKGNRCVVQNPWGSEEVVISQMGKDSTKPIAYVKGELIQFNTLPGSTYLIQRKNKRGGFNKTNFSSRKNQSPKYFHEAVLGKEKNF
jgi:hypothetical protein